MLTGNVWDGYLSLPFAVLDRAPRSIAILGNGAGTTVRAYARYFPETAIDGVEIDPELTELGREWFGLRDRPGLRLIHEDARPFLRRTDRRYDAIFVDAYRQPYIPFYLTTRGVLRPRARAAEPGRHVIVNAGHPEGSRELEKVLAAGVRSAFPHVVAFDITEITTLLVAGDRPPRAARVLAQPATVHAELRALFDAHRARPAPADHRREGLHRRPRAGRVADRPLARHLRRRTKTKILPRAARRARARARRRR